MFDKNLRAPIVEEYLAGGTSFRKMAEKYGINRYTINCWVNDYLRQKEEALIAANLQQMQKNSGADKKPVSPEEELQQLRQQLERERLRNKLLNAIIETAEETLKIPIRKKFGARQCKK